MAYTLATAAEAAKVTKPTVFRWVKAGRITATRAKDGTYRIEPVELHRYVDSIAKDTPAKVAAQQADAAADTVPETIEAVALRYEVEKLKAFLEPEKQRADELRQDRDRWVEQAQRLALPSPETPRNGSHGRRWWSLRAG
jgi:excisionase family DNA binding protein